MDRANLPDWTKYVLISYVVAYLIFYAMLNVSEGLFKTRFLDNFCYYKLHSDNFVYHPQNLAIVSDIKAHQNSLKGAERPQSSTPPVSI